MNLALLGDYGIDVEDGLARCLDDRELYENVLRLFLEDDFISAADAALSKDDYQALFRAVHGLKGAAGNAGLASLYALAVRLADLLRHGEPDPAEAKRLYADVKAAYGKARDGIVLADEA